MTEVGTGSLLNRYLPTVAAGLAAVNLGIMHWGTQALGALHTVLIIFHAIVIVLAILVQLEAVKRNPENYPRWSL
mgnify:CR=1 FL=1